MRREAANAQLIEGAGGTVSVSADDEHVFFQGEQVLVDYAPYVVRCMVGPMVGREAACNAGRAVPRGATFDVRGYDAAAATVELALTGAKRRKVEEAGVMVTFADFVAANGARIAAARAAD